MKPSDLETRAAEGRAPPISPKPPRAGPLAEFTFRLAMVYASTVGVASLALAAVMHFGPAHSRGYLPVELIGEGGVIYDSSAEPSRGLDAMSVPMNAIEEGFVKPSTSLAYNLHRTVCNEDH